MLAAILTTSKMPLHLAMDYHTIGPSNMYSTAAILKFCYSTVEYSLPLYNRVGTWSSLSRFIIGDPFPATMFLCINIISSEEIGHDHVHTKSGCVAPYKHYTKPKSRPKAFAAFFR